MAASRIRAAAGGRERARRWGALAAAVVVLACVPLLSDRWVTTFNLAAISVVGAVALMILTGFAGQISLGHAGFLAIGAYTTAILGAELHLPFYLALPAAGLVAAVVGLGIGVFALRLQGLHLAIVTIGLLYLVQHVLHALPELTGGARGMAVPMYVVPGDTPAQMRDIYAEMVYGPIRLDFSRKLYLIFAVITAAVVVVATNLRRSGIGRAMLAVQGSELAASSLGIDAARVKVVAFTLSSLLAGIAGGMFGLQQQYLSIEPFDLTMSVEFIAMVVIGGLGSVLGAVVGAVVFVVATPLLQDLGSALPLLSRLSSAQQSSVLFALLVGFLLIAEPGGLHGWWKRSGARLGGRAPQPPKTN